MNSQAQHILELRDVSISYGAKEAVRNLSLSVRQGEVIGLVGESGSGKSTVLRAIAGLLGQSKASQKGSLIYKGTDLTELSYKKRAALCGAELAYVFQDPVASLDPLYTIKNQFDECIRAHRNLTKEALHALEVQLLYEMGLDNPEHVLQCLPQQLSGGMCQRVVLAFCLACDPCVLLADEPPSALDVAAQAQVLSVLKRIHEERNLAMIVVSHNMGVIAEMADYVGVMYHGTLVETGTVQEVLATPAHPYTKNLIQAIPKADGTLPLVPQTLHHSQLQETICSYAQRCAFYSDKTCSTLSKMTHLSNTHQAFCTKADCLVRQKQGE